MNTAVRYARQWTDIVPVFSLSHLRSAYLCTTLFLALLFISALSVVYVKDFNRRLFIEYQAIEMERNELQVDFGKLLLEQGTWSAQSRIQDIAQEKLEMRVPALEDVHLIRK